MRKSGTGGLVYSTDGGRMCPACRQPLAACTCSAAARAVPQGDGVARVTREKQGRGGKTDRTDAAGLLEADRCGAIRAVPVKTVEQQGIQGLHRLAPVATEIPDPVATGGHQDQEQQTETGTVEGQQAEGVGLPVLLPSIRATAGQGGALDRREPATLALEHAIHIAAEQGCRQQDQQHEGHWIDYFLPHVLVPHS